MIRRTTTAGRS